MARIGRPNPHIRDVCYIMLVYENLMGGDGDFGDFSADKHVGLSLRLSGSLRGDASMHRFSATV